MVSHPELRSSLGDAESIERALDSIASERRRLAHSELSARENLISRAGELITALETPLESILWLIWAEPTKMFAALIALDLKLFHTLVDDGGRPKSVAELAKPTGASTALVNRIARKLATMQMINETGPAEYAPNSLTHVLVVPKYSEGIRFCYDITTPSFVQMSGYFEKKGFENPHDPRNGPFQFANNGVDAFTWLNERPTLLEAFNAYIQGQREERPTWIDTGFYPVQECLIDGLKLEGDCAVLVDVGGSTGHVLEDFQTAVPGWEGRLVLQEQAPVIEHAISLNPNK